MIKIIKCPLKEKCKPIKCNFPPLANLHLELLEINKKIKPDAPKNIQEPIPNNFNKTSIFNEFRNKKNTKGGVHITPVKNESSSDDKDDDSSVEEDLVFSSLGEKTEEKTKKYESSSEEDENEDKENDENIVNNNKIPSKEEKPSLTPLQEMDQYLWKWNILKKQYPYRKFPEYDNLSDILEVKSTYDRTLKELTLDNNIKTYKTWLLYGFLGIEYFCTQFLHIDMSGFYNNQVESLSSYDSLLIELGEKSYISWSLKMPVELRLVAIILFNAGVFFVMKNMGNVLGIAFTSMINKDNNKTNYENDKNTMKGPTIKKEDILKEKIKQRKKNI